MSQRIRTRFAPSPTGFIHLGNIRSALYPWAFARRMQGDFILRIEDTDVERSSQAAVDVILESMEWLGLDMDEGPFYQMQRMQRYKEMIAQLLAEGKAYYCYMSTEELDALRERQREAGLKPRYDGTWRPEPGKMLPDVPVNAQPVVRFKNPLSGAVAWDDAVKGRIEIANEELDDLIIARSDGTPTYNFCVVIDDLDMHITHVIRGDDHVNNTPRQINIMLALGVQPPVYAHLPTILNEQGEKMSKRQGALSVMQYRDDGFLPEAIINYLARLGWAHGDAEIFSREQFVAWFDLEHLGKSPAQYNLEKLTWLNAHYIKQADNTRLAELVQPFLQAEQIVTAGGPVLTEVIALLKDRATTVKQLAEACHLFYVKKTPDSALLAQHLTPTIQAPLQAFIDRLVDIEWTTASIAQALKEVLAAHQLKMPQLAMPIRLLVTGQLQTPSLDATLALLGRECVLARLQAHA